MKTLGLASLVIALVWLARPAALHSALPAEAREAAIPDALKPWTAWALWDEDHRDCPRPFNEGKDHSCFWPSRMGLQAARAGGQFDLVVTVFRESWLPLPGGVDAWPQLVRTAAGPLPVVERAGKPAVRLQPGTHHVQGEYRWSELPQRIVVPPQIGILALIVEGKPVETPAWDAEGYLWLKRDGAAETTDKDFLAAKLYGALEDGNPLWLRTEIELTVSGKSREEDLGVMLPEGWKLAAITSAIPVAVDENGRMKAQVRAGKWTITADAFRFDNPKELRYAAGAKLLAAEQLLAFRSRPDFRVVEIAGAPSIDVSQTTFPKQWSELPVYRWETASPLKIEERMRGMGEQKPAGLKIVREWWLDEDGRGVTFRDQISGQMQQIWRLDAADGQALGSVQSGGQGQLITRNPKTAAPGVEIRTRAIDLQATGRMDWADRLPATGWQADADSVKVTWNLPPGWRLFALFGADWEKGDWLTAWTLLDLFLLLIFTLAVFRLWGFFPAVLAFLTFGLCYHEIGAPRMSWLLLLVPLALQRANLPATWARRTVAIGKWVAITGFVLIAVPFITRQVLQALYPQLEVKSQATVFGPDFAAREGGLVQNTVMEATTQDSSDYLFSRSGRRGGVAKSDNLAYDAKVRIQTGPGVPEWKWREVSFGWNGPVLGSQQVRPILIPLAVERGITIARVLLVILLAAVLLDARKLGGTIFRRAAKPAVAVLFAFFTLALAPAQAQFPDAATIKELRQRLLESSDAFPHAAEIPTVTLTIANRRVVIEAEVHAMARTAIPVPGRLPAWSPVSVMLDDQREVAMRRADGYLWVAMPAGVHRVRVEGMLAELTEWEWTYLLKPRQVKIDAPGWTFTGVRPDGAPEQQVFFVRQQRAAAGAASYDRQDLQTVAVIDRRLELGLVWQVSSTVTRLSPPGKAMSLRVPLLPGENVLTANAVVRDGAIEVRLGAQEMEFRWESGLATAPALQLATRTGDAWVERWHLTASPVWNVTIAGLAPTFTAENPDLIPTWQPWPGERVDLAINRPEAIAGATITVSKATHEISLGKRQRTSKLSLSLRCSLGEDFLVDLPAAAEITSLTHGGRQIPVRKDGTRVIVPVRPGEQAIVIEWKIDGALEFQATAETVRLPVESANVTTILRIPDDRWVLWAAGPQRGPAVRFWVVLLCSLLAALTLGKIAHSPIHTISWMLLVIGLTQVPLAAALIVVGWLFLVAWRGSAGFQKLQPTAYNLLQGALVAVTIAALGILIVAVGAGLLGNPEMFITGNGSSRTVLRWFQARSGSELPHPQCLSISLWWYRFAMLLWALWLAAALISWLRLAWNNFSSGGFFRKPAKPRTAPPPLPAQTPVDKMSA